MEEEIHTRLAVIEERIDSRNEKLDKVYELLVGNNKSPGLLTRMNLTEASIKRLWYFLGFLLVVLSGLLCKLVVF